MGLDASPQALRSLAHSWESLCRGNKLALRRIELFMELLGNYDLWCVEFVEYGHHGAQRHLLTDHLETAIDTLVLFRRPPGIYRVPPCRFDLQG
jgi:hypothetical protein